MNNELHETFKKMWDIFNEVRKNNTDEGWAKCVEDSETICKNIRNKMIEKIMLALVAEAESESKIKNIEERTLLYRAAAKAYSEAWSLYESLDKTFDINTVHAYCENNNKSEFSKKLCTAIYENACGKKFKNGNFAKSLYGFYEKLKSGIACDEAYMEMESMIDIYPAYTLQIMDVYHEFQKKNSEYKSFLIVA